MSDGERISNDRLLGAIDAKTDALIREIGGLKEATQRSLSGLHDAFRDHQKEDDTRFGEQSVKLAAIDAWRHKILGIIGLATVLMPIFGVLLTFALARSCSPIPIAQPRANPADPEGNERGERYKPNGFHVGTLRWFEQTKGQ